MEKMQRFVESIPRRKIKKVCIKSASEFANRFSEDRCFPNLGNGGLSFIYACLAILKHTAKFNPPTSRYEY
jgi:hypothetical protein